MNDNMTSELMGETQKAIMTLHENISTDLGRKYTSFAVTERKRLKIYGTLDLSTN